MQGQTWRLQEVDIGGTTPWGGKKPEPATQSTGVKDELSISRVHAVSDPCPKSDPPSTHAPPGTWTPNLPDGQTRSMQLRPTRSLSIKALSTPRMRHKIGGSAQLFLQVRGTPPFWGTTPSGGALWSVEHMVIRPRPNDPGLVHVWKTRVCVTHEI